MRRQQKYPDTDTFHYYNANPKNRITGDCVVRAIAVACEVPYNQVVMDLARVHCETGYEGESRKGFGLLLEEYGFTKHKQPRKEDNTKFTGEEFCELIADTSKRYVANIGGNHVVAIVGGKVWDIWNSTHGCIGNYWTK